MSAGPERARGGYVGRFAPSPTGPLHAGSLVAAMASYLDARAHGGRWLLRIEDIDTARVVPGADRVIMGQLQALGMRWDGSPLWQSTRYAAYQEAFDALAARGLVYGCACTRRDIDLALAALGRRPDGVRGEPAGEWAAQEDIQGGGARVEDRPEYAGMAAEGLHERPYPGTCSAGLAAGRVPRAWRFRTPAGIERFDDRWLGRQEQDVAREVGDFVLKRADGLWAYQLAVVVDDGAQGVSDIVRGADLLGSTARQRVLARSLGLVYPRVMHVPLVLDEWGRKLSKQNHAAPLDCSRPVEALNAAWRQLGFEMLAVDGIESFWQAAQGVWAGRFDVVRK